MKPTVASTISEIASKAGVSIATVSRAINGKEGVGSATRERILEIARTINYYPNLQARGLAAKKSTAIGIIIPQTSEFAFSNPYYAEIIKGIGKKAQESNQYLVLCIAEMGSYVRMYQHRLVAGIIILANRIDDSRIEEAYRMKVPIVLIPGDTLRPALPSVDVDNVEGAFKAVEHLVKLGHRRIAFLGGPMNSKYSIERFAGYRKALEKNRLPFENNFVVESDFTQEGAYVGMGKLLSMERPPTAVLLISDYTAMGALQAVKKRNWRVPEDISIVGFGDVPFASMTDPPLTTFHEPFQKVGQEAATLLLKIIQGKKLVRKHLIFPMELVVRESTAPPSNSRNKGIS